MQFHFGGICKAVDSGTAHRFSGNVCFKRTKRSSGSTVQQILRRLVVLIEIFVMLTCGCDINYM